MVYAIYNSCMVLFCRVRLSSHNILAPIWHPAWYTCSHYWHAYIRWDYLLWNFSNAIQKDRLTNSLKPSLTLSLDGIRTGMGAPTSVLRAPPASSGRTTTFDSLSWHDNHIHGFMVCEGQDGACELRPARTRGAA